MPSGTRFITEQGDQLQEDSFYRTHIGSLNPLFES
jgi:hypothetical protein